MAPLPITGTPYGLLRNLTPPVVAVTARAGERINGMIANSAQRASLVPSISRISLYISKTNHTHDMVYSSGILGVHMLRRDQWDLIWQLGFQSGRDTDKLDGLDLATAVTGCPLIVDSIAAFDCRVVNAMDAGASTFFLADVVAHLEGTPADVMSSGYFRAHIPEDKRRIYEERLADAMQTLEPMARDIRRDPWPGASGAGTESDT